MLRLPTAIKKTLKRSFGEVAEPIILRRDDALKDCLVKNAADKYRNLKDLKEYFYAAIPRPCTCNMCKASVAHKNNLVEARKVSISSKDLEGVLETPLAKFVEECERKSAVHELEGDDLYLDALISFNYFNWLRPVPDASLRCACELISMFKRMSPDQWLQRVRCLASVVDIIEWWNDHWDASEKADKSSFAAVDLLKQYPLLRQQMIYGENVGFGYYAVGYFTENTAQSHELPHVHLCCNRSCGNIEWSPKEYKVCSLCMASKVGVMHFYCSVACQHQDWTEHHQRFHELVAK